MNGVFAVAKPSGPTSADVVQKLKHIFSRSPEYLSELKNQPPPSKHERRKRQKWIKIGHGGTLDPLADGVLVIGVGRGTKQLQSYLGNCSKTYTATALLGASTTTYDKEGSILEYGAVDKEKLTPENLNKVLEKFRGAITQLPPVFSALKMDGKPLYEYAREGIALPRAIEKRDCNVSLLEGSVNSDVSYELPKSVATDKEREFAASVVGVPLDLGEPPATTAVLELRFDVSSGTYIRSLIHDIGIALGTRAHMVRLTRETQGEWTLGRNTLPVDLFDKEHDTWWPQLAEILENKPKPV